MKVNCLSCGFRIDLDESYNDYEGAIKCFACSATLEVKLSEERVKSVRLVDLTGHATAAGKSRSRA